MNPLIIVIVVAVGISVACWIASLVTRDTSWVDRVRSIAPVCYLWIFASFAEFTDTRLNVMAVLLTLWGARLTFNFARKGGYSGVEDYRWAVLRGRMSPLAFHAFNLFFIVIYQNALLAAITFPELTALESPRAFGALDTVVTVFGTIAAGTVPWTIVGAILLTALFIGSTIFTESITRSKYPEYANYQAKTSMLIPWFQRETS